jgi:hypothetical protein
MIAKESWAVWKTIQIGINHDLVKQIKDAKPYETDGRLIEPHSQKRYSLEPSAMDMIQRPEFTVEASPREVKLVVVALRSLGLPDGTCYSDIFAAAEKVGLQRCPAEVGLQLRVQYMNQPLYETLVVAMQPIMDTDELASVFIVHYGDWGITLGGGCCGISNNEDEWHADSEWVFVGG